MRILKFLGARVLAVAIALSVVPAAVPQGTPLVGISKAEAQPRYYGGRRGGYYGGSRYNRGRGYYRGRDYYGGRRYSRDRYYGRRYRDRSAGAAVAAGIIGLGVGAAIASQPRYYAPAPRYYGRGLSGRDRSCLARFRSYDVYSKTYQPYSGPRRICYG